MILNIHAPINVTSYGYVSCNVIKELKKLNVDLRHIPIGRTDPDKEILPDIIDVLQNWEYSFDAPSLKIWHQNDLGSFCGKGMRIGMPIFELEKFNKYELHSLQNPDKLFVCSNWAKNVIESEVPNSIGNTHVIPLGVDNNIFKQTPMPNIEKTIFGNFGKWEVRKGHNELVEIFNKAFEKDDDVLLVMMPHNFFLTEEETTSWISKYKNTKLGDKILFINRQESHSMVYNIMRQIHCGVFPSRAEGWNLEALELLSIGRHLIITNATAHTEFCNSKNSHLIEMESGYESAKDIKFFDGSFEWRKFGENEIEQAVNHMRYIHKKRKEGNLDINKEGIKTGKQFSWENTALKIKETVWNLLIK